MEAVSSCTRNGTQQAQVAYTTSTSTPAARMPIIILIPTLISIIALCRMSVQKTFLNVFIPIFMLCPTYYYWKVAALPPIDLGEATLLPLGAAILFKEMRHWRPTTMDLWLAVFVFTSCYADSLSGHSTASTFDLFSALCIAVVPYMAGKVLIEQQGTRVETIKRIVFCLFIACIIGAYEYRMGENPFTKVWSRFFPDEHFPWKTQIRWGFGRVSGPYGQSELAGIVLFFGLVLALWLAYYHLWEPKFSRARWHPFTKSTVILWTLAMTLLMTQARGPWIGAIVAVNVALIGRAKRIVRTAMILTIIGVGLGGVAYVGLKHYVDSPSTSAEQETAEYRKNLLTNYIPVAEQGGPWGWGQDFPRVGGQGSIDNEYLFVALTQGWVGLAAFCLLALETVFRLLSSSLLNPHKRDRYFAFSLLGVFLGMMVTVFTVYLGNQPYSLFFLLAGWSQAIGTREAEATQPAFERVYT